MGHAYEQGDGVCLQHLPLVLRRCREGSVAQIILRAYRARHEMVAWGLAEFLRKENWSVRFEAKGPEQTAWVHAVAHYSGSPAIPRQARPEGG